MGLRTLAYAAEEPLLLAFDAALLLAADATTGAPKWQLALPRALAGVVVGAPNALPHAVGNPWRSAGATSIALAVDVEGTIHLVDALAGKLIGSIAGPGRPTALAAGNGVFAFATAERIVIWQDGERFEIAETASALALGDGALAIGTEKGNVIVYDLAAHSEARRHAVRGAVTAIAPYGDAWIVGTTRALWGIWSAEPVKVLAQAVDALAVRPGARVAVALDERIVLYEPYLARRVGVVELTRRDVHDLAYGPNGLLGVGLNRGDAAIIDEALRVGIRVGPHPGRPKPRWHARVDLDPTTERPTPRAVRARTGLGVVAAIAGVVVPFLLSTVAAERRTPAPSLGSPVHVLKDMQCDAACESTRLTELARVCRDMPDAECEDDAEAALASFAASHCDEAHASLGQISSRVARRTNDGMTLVRAYLALATLGLPTGCHEDVPNGAGEKP